MTADLQEFVPKGIRQMLGKRGIKPEELPVAEDIRKIERRNRTQDKKIVEKSGNFGESNKNEVGIER